MPIQTPYAFPAASGVSLSGTNTWTGPQTIQPATDTTGLVVTQPTGSAGVGIKVTSSTNNGWDGIKVITNNGTQNSQYGWSQILSTSTFYIDTQGGQFQVLKSGVAVFLQVNSNGIQLGPLSNAGLSGNAAGVVEINNGTAGGTGALKFNGYAVNSLPTGSIGMVACVTDALAPVVGSTVVNGGSAKALVWWNGSAWKVLAV